MKIDSEQLRVAVNTFKGDAVEKNGSVEKNDSSSPLGGKDLSQNSDRVEISLNSGEIDRLKKAMQEAPDVSSDKLAQLKQQIADGSYQVDGKAVAEKMLQRWSELNEK